MQIHDLKISIKKKKIRVGRGGKRGTYSGRGQKGQKSRAGRRIRPAERDLILKLPKLRGIKNKPIKPKPFNIKIKDLIYKVKLLKFNEVINDLALKQMDLLPMGYKGEIKIIGTCEEILPLKINKDIKISNKLKEKILAAGGEIK
jgi:large subunit ribosomal protein L15